VTLTLPGGSQIRARCIASRDPTGRLMHLQFVESESTFAYFHAARAYLEVWGKPVAFYGDKHGGVSRQPDRCYRR
jgi:hypothetical protein